MRSESVMPRLRANAFARLTSPSDMRTWICLGCRSIASAGASLRVRVSKEARPTLSGARGIPRKERSRARRGGRCRRAVSGKFVPVAMPP